MGKIVGIDVGDTKCAVILGESLTNNNVNILDRIAFPTEVAKGLFKIQEKGNLGTTFTFLK